MKCPHCAQNIDVQFIKAPANMQSQSPTRAATSDDLATILKDINDSTLEGQALDFVTQTRERFTKYKASTRMSDKQMNWLKKLAYGEQEDEWS